MQRIQIPILNMVEYHFYWGQLEMIWPHVQHWHSEVFHSITNVITSMVLSIIKHDHSILPPLMILLIQMFNQLCKVECKCLAIGLTFIDCEEDFIPIANSTDDIDCIKSTWSGNLILNTFDEPTSLARISLSNDCLINIDNSIATTQSWNEFSSSYLPLQLCIWVILIATDLLNGPIWNIQAWSQVMS